MPLRGYIPLNFAGNVEQISTNFCFDIMFFATPFVQIIFIRSAAPGGAPLGILVKSALPTCFNSFKSIPQ